jgi:biotin carboxyl carrier protein
MTLGSGRRGRHRRSRDPWAVPLVLIIAVILLAAIVLSRVGTVVLPKRVMVAGGVTTPVTRAVQRMQLVTPVFATAGTLRLRLPVPAEAVTTVAFHQASSKNAVTMTSLVPIMELKTASRLAAQKRAAKNATSTPPPAGATAASATAASTTAASSSGTPTISTGDVWGGKVIRLWRSGRTGKPETAVDVGAAPGTQVVAPVNGTVVYVRAYKLYGTIDDYEVHIAPDGQPELDVVLIHITDVCVTPGQRVEAGATVVAAVRRLSKSTSLQLAQYTADGGDHTHLQVNRTPKPGSIWVSTPGSPMAVPIEGSDDASAPPMEAPEP